jgi:hypothetical protein
VYIWTGFYETAILHADILRKEAHMNQNVPLHRSLTLKPKLFSLLGRRPEGYDSFVNEILPYLVWKTGYDPKLVDGYCNGESYDQAACFVVMRPTLELVHEVSGMMSYPNGGDYKKSEELLKWLIRAYTRLHGASFLSTPLYDELLTDLQLMGDYDWLLEKQQEYMLAIQELARDLKFADIEPKHNHHPHLQHDTFVFTLAGLALVGFFFESLV